MTVGLSSPAVADPPWETVDDIICRAQSGVGFSYWWGGECWCRSGCDPDTSCGVGSCSGSCPNCTHSGSYGADCSGYVSRVWQVPYAIPVDGCHTDRYVASSFTSSGPYWDQVSRDNVVRGDALASSSHVILYESDDPWGWMWAYEARGCSYGIVHNSRTCSSAYSAARRLNIESCVCNTGDTENQPCGNCGIKTRTCGANCEWGDWSACTGEGECPESEEETVSCGDCGTQTRICDFSCNWGSWTPCEGPDPQGGEQVCDTGLAGACSEGRIRCVSGTLECISVIDTAVEICDGIDNDCNGAIDDGHPQQISDPPPDYAADLTSSEGPATLSHGESVEISMTFVNVGSETWRPGEVRLIVPEPLLAGRSVFYDAASWSGPQVAANLDNEVIPGGSWEVYVTVFPDASAWGTTAEVFQLQGPGGALFHCPRGEWTFEVQVDGEGPPPDGGVGPSNDGSVVVGDGGGGPVASVNTTYTGGCNCTAALIQHGSNTGSDEHLPLHWIVLVGLLFSLCVLPRLRR